MNKQERHKTYMILIISSDGNQNNVFLFLLATDRHFVRFFGSPLSASLTKTHGNSTLCFLGHAWKFHFVFT